MRQHKMKQIGIIITILFLICAIAPINSTKAVSDSARAAILLDQTSGRVLYEKNAHESMRIASITKVMTALLAIESGKMDETVTISDRAEGTEGSSIYLKKGEKWKLRDLVYGLMLRSGNDSAVAIAEKVGGSLEGFIYKMNEKAHELGMNDTHFANPHGLDDSRDQHYSSAYDMAILTRYAMQNKEFRKIFGTKTYRVKHEGKTIRLFKNKNKLLFNYNYSTGGKTGYTKLAHRTLISTASKNDMHVIVVTLDDGNDWDDHMNLCNWAFNTYQLKTIVKKGEISGIKNKFYKNSIYAKRSLIYPLTKKEEESLKTSMSLYSPPKDQDKKNYKAPEPVGILYVKSDGEVLTKLPLFYSKHKAKEEKHGFWASFKSIFMMSLGIGLHD